MLKSIINRTFGIRDGEIYISFLMQLYIFIIITVLLIVKPTVNALFLSQLGADSLPYGYLLVAVVAVLTSYFYNKAIRKFSLLKVTSISLVVFSLGFLGLSAILEFSYLKDWVLYFYYLGVSLFAVMATSQFWVLANMVFNVREAKRLFGFIGAGAIAGGVFGGYLTSLVVTAFGNKQVIFLAAILILCCIPIIRKIWKLRIHKLNAYVRMQRKHNEATYEESSFKIIAKSKHLTFLALITGIGVIVAKLVDFQFSDFANKAITDTDELASFFGFWFSTFNVLALVLQLFLTNRVLSKLGVASTMLILPLAIGLGSLLFLTFPELWVLVIIKGIDGSFKQSLNKAAVELSIMPIPLQIKNQAKSYIDVAVDSIATGIAGFMLIFLIKRLDLNTSYITIIIILFVFIWILLIYRLREAYFESFRTNIERTLNENLNTAKRSKNESTIAYARRILMEGQELQILALLERLNTSQQNSLKQNVIGLLNHPSNRIKSAAIKQFYLYDKGTALDKVEHLIGIKDDELVFTALAYILNHSSIKERQFFSKYLDHKSDYIANAALLCLAKEASENQKLALQFGLYSRIDNRVTILNNPDNTERESSIAELLITIAESKMVKHYSFIAVHLHNKSQYIVKHAIKAAGITANEQFIEALLQLLLEKRYRKRATMALRDYGVNMIDYIIKLEKSEIHSKEINKYIPKIIESFSNQKAVAILLRLLISKDIVIRLAASKSLTKLKRKSSKLYFNKRSLKKRILNESRYYKRSIDAIASLQNAINLKLVDGDTLDHDTEILIARQSLIEVLDDQADLSLKAIFNLLSLVYEESDIDMTYAALSSNIKEARINALEFLDNLLQRQLKHRILPLVEYHVVAADDRDRSTLQLHIMKEQDCLNMLIKNRGKRIKLEALNLITKLDDTSYLPMIKKLMNHQNKDVQFFANGASQILRNKSLH